MAKELEMNSWNFFSGLEGRKKHLKLLQLIPLDHQLILDAGCGPGTYGVILAQEGNEVIGIDISFAAVRVGIQRANETGAKFFAAVGDLENLPFTDNYFDVCFCGWTLHHFPDICPPLVELARVIKYGGKIALVEQNGSNPIVKFSDILEKLMRGWLGRSGLDSENETIHKPEIYIETLKKQGFTEIKVSSCFTGGLPPLPPKAQKGGLNYMNWLLIHILVRLRRLLFMVALRVLPKPLNGTDLLIVAAKGGMSNEATK
jgi:ubiquinone/menaquinone biosynthesis C-methylase UbiE